MEWTTIAIFDALSLGPVFCSLYFGCQQELSCWPGASLGTSSPYCTSCGAELTISWWLKLHLEKTWRRGTLSDESQVLLPLGCSKNRWSLLELVGLCWRGDGFHDGHVQDAAIFRSLKAVKSSSVQLSALQWYFLLVWDCVLHRCSDCWENMIWQNC